MKQHDDSVETKDGRFVKIGIIAAILIFVLWISTFFIFNTIDTTNKGTYGDFFNIINSLFSGLALAGIILTILLQKNELALQRQELKETREELKRTANAQENSEKALNRQAENLKISAKLTALNTLVNYYSNLEVDVRKGQYNEMSWGEISQKKEKLVLRIEEILETKEAMN